MRFVLLLLTGCSMLAQKPLAIGLLDIKTDRSKTGVRLYNISYSLTNETDRPIAFFLTTTEGFIPQISSSSSAYVHYRLFQDGKPVDAPGVFTFGVATWMSDAEMERKLNSVRSENRDVELLLKRRRDYIASSLMKLEPKQSKLFSVVMAWDHERYQRYDEMEYYLDSNDQYVFELSAHLMKEELYDEFKAVDMEKLLDEPHLVTGWITSNRMPIDLSP
ncbi:hypothetical protein [Flavobacterium selenitireducens]|uniref:hypothetical protein n=1 Tax=Flavobacterium selenitireducens TaxID=2722704 RepID=UPI00168B3B83|nr:hypothetical protein [Flavobacterium selenitireducens]MBD3581974.1 hypothetical protein [Flavobacterium selenitireducens]